MRPPLAESQLGRGRQARFVRPCLKRWSCCNLTEGLIAAVPDGEPWVRGRHNAAFAVSVPRGGASRPNILSYVPGIYLVPIEP